MCLKDSASPFCEEHFQQRVLGGSWVVISGVISPLIWVTSIVTLLMTLLITTMNLQVEPEHLRKVP